MKEYLEKSSINGLQIIVCIYTGKKFHDKVVQKHTIEISSFEKCNFFEDNSSFTKAGQASLQFKLSFFSEDLMKCIGHMTLNLSHLQQKFVQMFVNAFNSRTSNTFTKYL